MVKPVVLKAGIPLALSMAAFLFSKFLARKAAPEASVLENESNLLKQMNHFGEEEPMSTNASFVDAIEIAEVHQRPRSEAFQKLKEEESLLIELLNLLTLKTAHLKFLDREILYMEENEKRVENLIMEYLRGMEQHQNQKSENRLLEIKMKEISRKISGVRRERNVEIEEREVAIYRKNDEIEKKDMFIRKMEDEVRDLQRSLNQLQQEKNDLLEKIENLDALASKTKIKAEMVTMEDFAELIRDTEELKSSQLAEVNEMISLKSKNESLPLELVPIKEAQVHGMDDYRPDREVDYETSEKNKCSFVHARGRKLIRRLRKLILLTIS